MKDRRHGTEALPAPTPDLRRRIIRSVSEAAALHAIVLNSAERTAVWLRGFKGSPLDLLTALRFQMVGHDPISGKALNMIEQINQTFTILVSLRAVEQLIELHPEADGFRLALGTCSGRDIQSVEPNLVAAEVFSATHPGSNQKLKKDIARLKPDTALHRYVFFAAPNYKPGRQADLETERGIAVHCVEL
jgi:hypothetical protein